MSETTTVPSLDMLIRESVEMIRSTGHEYTVDEVAADVLLRIDRSHFDRYITEAVRFRLSSVVGSMRNAVTPGIRQGVSTKQSLIRDEYWPEFLRQQVALPGGYKSLAEATAEDLRFLADVRRTQANELLTRASQFSTLADLMDAAHVRVLEQLDPQVGEREIRRAA